jgi:hypothetical protein
MVVDRAALAESLGWLDRNRSAPIEHLSKRTFYGNWARIGGVESPDVKVMRGEGGLPQTDLPFLLLSCPKLGGAGRGLGPADL